MDENAQTVANFLKFYNPSIVGGSLGHHIVEVRHSTDCTQSHTTVAHTIHTHLHVM